MTRDNLVQAVTALTPATGCPIVTSAQIKAWCLAQNPIVEIGVNQAGRANRHFEDADHGEAAGLGRLAKFKNGFGQSDDVGWCLIEDLARCAECNQAWRQLPFNPATQRWDWT
jgi:hypothetical protein